MGIPPCPDGRCGAYRTDFGQNLLMSVNLYSTYYNQETITKLILMLKNMQSIKVMSAIIV